MKIKKGRKAKKSHFREWLEAILWAMTLVLTIKAFVFDIYIVPSTSMENTIKSGDVVLVNKFKYGARLPITPLSIPFLHQHFPYQKQWKAYSTIIQLPIGRLFAFKNFSHNDLVVFNYPIETQHPIDHRTLYVKRLAGMPGDSLSIFNGNIFVNRQKVPSAENVKNRYQLSLNKILDLSEIEAYEIYEWQNTGPMTYSFYLTLQQFQELQKNPKVKNIKPLVDGLGKGDMYIYNFHPDNNWNKDFFGPVYIPKKGDTLTLTQSNIYNWIDLLNMHENVEIKLEEGVFTVNDSPADYYIFKNNYYFVLGDNRGNSADSRFWGLLPETHLIGSPSFVLFSINKKAGSFFKKLRWQRILKSLE